MAAAALPNALNGDYSKVDPKTQIIVVSNDTPPVEYALRKEAAKMSGLVKDLLDAQDESSTEAQKVDLPKVDGRTLRYVVQWLEYHFENKPEPIEKPLTKGIEEIVSEWDRNFLFTDLIEGGDEMKKDLLVSVVLAANFMNIPQLLELTCAACASMMRTKTAEEVRTLWGIVSDYTPEEEAEIREENRWIEEF